MAHRLFLILMAAWMLVSASGCGASDAAQRSDRPSPERDSPAPPGTRPEASAETTSTQAGDRSNDKAEPTIAARPATQATSASATSPPQGTPGAAGSGQVISLAETEALVKADLSAALHVPDDQISVVEAAARTWPDRGLGCGKRQGVFEPAPVPGYRLILSYAGVTFTYHADQQGRFIRCREPGKPFGPITR